MTQAIVYNEATHPYMASRRPNSGFFIRTPEAKGWRVAHGRGRAILDHLPERSPIWGLELGVNEGYLSHHLLCNRPDLFMFMVDCWRKEKNLIAMGLAINMTYPFEGRRHIVRAVSAEAAKLFPDGVLDFVFIDADHSYEDVKHDIQVWRPKLRPGGLLCGHDMHIGQTRKAVEELVPGYTTGEDSTWFAPVEGEDEQAGEGVGVDG